MSGTILTAFVLFAASPDGDPAAARKKAADRNRRVIFNNDGGEPSRAMRTPTEKEFLDLRTTKLAGTHVDSIFYCSRSSGFSLFTHFTKIGQVFTSTEGGYANNQMPGLLKAGLDPLKMQVDFARKHGLEIFWSMRMNDNHDASTAEYGPILFRHNKLKNEHPEYLLGTAAKRPKHGAWTAVDYARPEIRDLAFRYVEEVCLNYDIDGVELDFFRHPMYFRTPSRGEPATDAERAAMTDLVKRIRAMTEARAAARGKPILVAVKAPDSLGYCHAMGLDLEEWLKRGYLDLFIPGGRFQLNDWDYSVGVARKHGVKIYPSLDNPTMTDKAALAAHSSLAAYRGRAAKVWAAGGDGVYFYNYPQALPELLTEAGDPKKLARLDRDYYPAPRGVGNSSSGNLPFEKFQTHETLNPSHPKPLKPGVAATARLRVGESAQDDTPRTATVRVQLKNPPEVTALRVVWNGQPLDLTAADAGWYEAKLIPKAVLPGENRLELKYEGEAKNVLWTEMVLQVRPMPVKP